MLCDRHCRRQNRRQRASVIQYLTIWSDRIMRTGFTLLITVALIGWGPIVGDTPAEPVRIIFDTDMDTDCDDAGALAMLHAFADQGKVKILATTVSSKFPYSAPCTAAINSYFGRSDVPIGVPKGEGASTKRGSKYAKQIAAKFRARFKTNDDAPDARAVYRKVLASQPDQSVVIVSVGYLTNLKDLLLTPPDEHSKLDGRALVARKVKQWVCMGGAYPKRTEHGGYGNFMPHAAATVASIRDWPGNVYFSGNGKRIHTGRLLRTKKATGNPVARVYEIFLGSRKTRPSWDQVALLYAVDPEAPFWKVTSRGYNHIFPNGTNHWREAPDDPRHHLVDVNPNARDKVKATIEQLMAHAPQAANAPNLGGDAATDHGAAPKKKKEFVRVPVGPILGHLDEQQALMFYRADVSGDLDLVVRDANKKDARRRRFRKTALRENDFCITWRATELTPDTEYQYFIARAGKPVTKTWTFRTPPRPEDLSRASFGFGSCVNSKGDEELWRQVGKSGCDGFVMLGDTPYINSPRLKHIRPLRRKFLRLPSLSKLAKQMPLWWTWDDHDSFIRGNKEQWKKDSCRKGFIEYTALNNYGENGRGIYTKFRRGPIEVFVLDTRWFYRAERSFADPEQLSLIGKQQWNWLQRELKASTATFKVLACGVVWYKKISEGDSWGHYPHERDALFEFIGKEKISGVVLVGGDIHSSSAAVFDAKAKAGYNVHAFTISPMHDGTQSRHNYKDRPYIKWGAPIPHVFLRVSVDSGATPATLTATWIQMTGKKVHEVKLNLNKLSAAKTKEPPR